MIRVPIMRQQPTYISWRITCHSPKEAQALQQWLSSRIDLDRVLTDTVHTYPDGVEHVETVRHRLGDYFTDIRMESDAPAAPESFRIVFQRRPDAGRFWKDLMVDILQEIETAPQKVSIAIESKGNVETPTSSTSLIQQQKENEWTGDKAVIPRTLNEWTLDSLKYLLNNRYLEPESFDYKSRLPDSRDEDGKKRLRDACAAFANSSGGFLVFGVADDARLPADHRLVGLPISLDFPVHFGNYPSQCNPTVRWEFKNPPIRLSTGNLVHVVWFRKSWNAPHSAGKSEEGLLFPKRTNKGTEYMSYEEVRMTFLGYYEKRLKLQLLQAELQNILADASALMVAPEQSHQSISTASFRLEVLESILVDTFTILAEQTDLLKSLHAIRTTAKHVNNKLALFYPTANLPFDNNEQRLRNHNEWLRVNVPPIVKSAEDALRQLTQFLATS
jgi:hypothetical protein